MNLDEKQNSDIQGTDIHKCVGFVRDLNKNLVSVVS